MATNGRKSSEATTIGLIPEPAAAKKCLHMSTRSLQRERKRGRIEFYRVGIRVYYTEEQIKSYLQRHCVSVARTRSTQAAAA